MQNIESLYQPQSLPEALRLLGSEGGLRLLAGGTDMLPEVRESWPRAYGLIDLSQLQELKGIKYNDGVFEIGSLTTFSQLENSAILQENAPLLAEAAGSVGSPQIRSLGTIGGNIANASPAADTVTALAALEARVKLVSSEGSRIIPLSEFLCGVGKTRILPGEIITGVVFEAPPEGLRSGFVKLGRRKALAIARMSVAGYAAVKDGTIVKARIALGAVAPNPCRSEALESLLNGHKPTRELLEEVSAQAEPEIVRLLGTRPSVSYKRQAVKGIMRQLLTKIFAAELGVGS